MVAAVLKTYQFYRHSIPFIPGLIRGKLILTSSVEAEILLSIWLLVGGFAGTRSLAALICFGVFAMIAGYEALRAMPSCGCFGNVKVSPAVTATFDVVAVIALWFTRPHRPTVPSLSPSRRRALCGAVVAAAATAILWNGYLLKLAPANSFSAIEGDGVLVVLEPQSWLNKQLEIIGDIDSGEPLRHGRWLLVFYHYDCDDCRQAIPRYCALTTESGNSSVRSHLAFIAMPPLAPSAEEDPVPASPSYLHLKLHPSHDWFATTPVVAALQDGKVLFAADGEQAVYPPQWP
jgi:hypothetical protein